MTSCVKKLLNLANTLGLAASEIEKGDFYKGAVAIDVSGLTKAKTEDLKISINHVLGDVHCNTRRNQKGYLEIYVSEPEHESSDDNLVFEKDFEKPLTVTKEKKSKSRRPSAKASAKTSAKKHTNPKLYILAYKAEDNGESVKIAGAFTSFAKLKAYIKTKGVIWEDVEKEVRDRAKVEKDEHPNEDFLVTQEEIFYEVTGELANQGIFNHATITIVLTDQGK